MVAMAEASADVANRTSMLSRLLLFFLFAVTGNYCDTPHGLKSDGF